MLKVSEKFSKSILKYDFFAISGNITLISKIFYQNSGDIIYSTVGYNLCCCYYHLVVDGIINVLNFLFLSYWGVKHFYTGHSNHSEDTKCFRRTSERKLQIYKDE